MLADMLYDISDRIADEFDRAYLGSTNDADRLRAIARELDELTAEWAEG